MLATDLFLFRRDENGNPTFSQHRVWNPARFVDAQMNEAAKLNEKHNSTKAVAVQITAEAYKTRQAPL